MMKTDEDTLGTYDTTNTDGQSSTSSSNSEVYKRLQLSAEPCFTRVSVMPLSPNNTSHTAVVLTLMHMTTLLK